MKRLDSKITSELEVAPLDINKNNDNHTRKVVHTHVEARIRGVIGLLIGLRPEIDGLHIMYV